MSLYVDIKKRLGDFTLETRFEADAGVTGILGASGCGKSMTLRCIAGIVRPDRGRIEVDGTVFFDSEKRIDLKPQERHVGLLFQNYALFPNMTVRQNLLTGTLHWEKDRGKAVRFAAEMAERFRLTGLEEHKPAQLSGGQQQRAALARILLSKPRILMLDEPFSALDDYLRWNLELELQDVLREFGGATLFVSHSRDEIYRICGHACVMDRGKAGEVIPVRQLFEAPKSRAAALLSGCKNFSRAEKAEGEQIFAKDWGVTLKYAGEAPENLRYIGVRSHYISPISSEATEPSCNRIHCKIVKLVEDVFSMVILVRPLSAEKKDGETELYSGQIRVEVTKEFWKDFSEKENSGHELWIHVEPEDIMLLE